MRSTKLLVAIVGTLLAGVSLFGCSKSASTIHISSIKSKGVVDTNQQSSSTSTNATDVGCVPTGATKTYETPNLAALLSFLDAHSARGEEAYSVAQSSISTYLRDAWPTGTVSGLPSVSNIQQWIHVMNPSNSLVSTLVTGPESISSWQGGQPTPAQATNVGYDARFLFYIGKSSLAPSLSPWGSATLVGTRTTYLGRSFSYGSNGVVGMCIGWWVETGRQVGNNFTWWYIHGVASMVPTTTGWLMQNPVTSGWIYDQPGSPSAEPNWIELKTAASPAPRPTGAVSMSLN